MSARISVAVIVLGLTLVSQGCVDVFRVIESEIVIDALRITDTPSSLDFMSNDDGVPSPGETALIDVRVRYVGLNSIDDVTGVIASSHEGIEIVEGEKTFASLSAGQYSVVGGIARDSASEARFGSSEGYKVRLHDVQSGEVIPFEIVFGTSQESYEHSFNMIVEPTGANLVVESSRLFDGSGGNGDGVANANESIEMDVRVQNSGTSAAEGLSATLSTNDSYVTITNNTIPDNADDEYDDLMSGEFDTLYDSTPSTDISGARYDSRVSGFTFDIGAAPANHSVTFTLTMTDELGNSWDNDFSITVQ